MTIEEKAKEYVVNQVVPKLGITMPISPLIEANVRMETEDALIAGAECMLEKAKLWLKENAQNYWEDASQHDNCYYDDEELVNDFKKAMEG